MNPDADWWKRAVIYQIYPRSFQDSNGDGVGDLAGVRARLDYLVWLGIDAIWLSPFYPSPMADFGYDIADYCDVDPIFGTLTDFDGLLAAAHGRGLKVIVDLVPNHTSDQHPWFIESRESRTSPKRDWYIWRDANADGGPPNNWVSDFGGSAWQWDAASGQYYYHAFLPQQPDLNWRNPSVRRAMQDVMRFWLDRGVDGFRVDVMWHLIKRADFPDNPINPNYRLEMGEMHAVLQTHSTDQPETHEVVAQMRAMLDRYHARVLLGEIYLPIDALIRYYGGGRGAHLPLNFHLIETPWTPQAIGALIVDYEAALPAGAWPNWVMGNHDRPRIAARIGETHARLAALLLLTLRGTPTLFYGDELGLPDAPIAPEATRDPRELREPGLGLGRDPARSPMPWDSGPFGGFSVGPPWLPLPPAFETLNVAAQRAAPFSLLELYRSLLALRKRTPALHCGAIEVLEAESHWLVYERRYEGEVLRIAFNFGEPRAVPGAMVGTRLLLSTALDQPEQDVSANFIMRANEGLIGARKA